MEQTKILIADDHPVFLFGLQSIINTIDNCVVVNVASDGVSALSLIRSTKPNIVILDIDMPGLNGIQVAKKVSKLKPPIKIVFLTMNKDESIFNLAFDSGAISYVIKDNAAIDIVRCIKSVSNGDFFVSPQINAYHLNRISSLKSTDFSLINRLTDTEKLVLKEVSENRSSLEIAVKLSITNKTVQNHRFNICKKMKLEGVNSLLSYALLNKQTIQLILPD
tara:strand:- start:26 stop:688 length:663 start_codon:yes stop_codon:yes gene_type:complete